MAGSGGQWMRAPAVELVATRCCVCGHPLLDAESLHAGIGPTCAEVTGLGREAVSAEVRERVNQLVYELAAYQRSPEAVSRVTQLRELGFAQLADRIEQRLTRLVEVRLELSDEGLVVVQLPRLTDEQFRAWVAGMRAIPGRRLRTVQGYRRRVDVVPNTPIAKRQFYGVLTRVVPGVVARGPKGLFVVGGVE